VTHAESKTERSIFIKWKSRLFTHNIYVIPITNAMKRASSVWKHYQTHKRMRNCWRKLKNNESNSFSS